MSNNINKNNDEKISKNEMLMELLKLLGPIVLIIVIYYVFFA
ncbi:MAG: hypothetical protein WAR79_12180 [Melioribacteraceae bacterium]